MKAIMTVTCVMGENIQSVSPSTHSTKGRKKDSKLVLQGPTVFIIYQHVRQPHSLLLDLKDIHSRKHHLNFAPALSRPSYFPDSHAVFFLRVLFGGQLLSPSCCHQLSAVQRGSGQVHVLLPHPSSSCRFQPKSCQSH